jgi:hypothetical protein
MERDRDGRVLSRPIMHHYAGYPEHLLTYADRVGLIWAGLVRSQPAWRRHQHWTD